MTSWIVLPGVARVTAAAISGAPIARVFHNRSPIPEHLGTDPRPRTQAIARRTHEYFGTGFVAGKVTTSFIDERLHLLTARRSADRGTRLLTYLAETTVNQPHGPNTATFSPRSKLPELDLKAPRPRGSRDDLLDNVLT